MIHDQADQPRDQAGHIDHHEQAEREEADADADGPLAAQADRQEAGAVEPHIDIFAQAGDPLIDIDETQDNIRVDDEQGDQEDVQVDDQDGNSGAADNEYSEGDEIQSDDPEHDANEEQLNSDVEEEAEESDNESEEETDSDQSLVRTSNPANLPNVGARITFRNPGSNVKTNATITKMHRTMQYQWPGWRNIKIDGDQFQSSVNMDVIGNGCVAWRYLGDAPPMPRAPGDGYIPQYDGNYTLPAGPSYRDYGEAFTDSELAGGVTHEQGFDRAIFVPPSRPRALSPPPPLQPRVRSPPGRVRQLLSRITRHAWPPFRRN